MSRTVLITGASRGIGAATALRFARAGDRVAINYLNSRDAAEALSRALCQQGFQASPFRADVSCDADVCHMINEIHSAFGPVDILVNNAGIAEQKPFASITDADWERMFSVNVKSAYLCSRAVLPDFLRKQSGCIINLSSVWGRVGASCEVHYSASKAAVIGFTKALAKELGPSGIRVNCIAPGVISTDMNAALSPDILDELRDDTPLERIGSAEQVADSIFFLASSEASFLTGQVLGVDGGFCL